MHYDDCEVYSIPQQISKGTIIKKVNVGYDHFLMIDHNDKLWVSGENVHGCLGTSDTTFRGSPQVNSFFDQMRVIDIACGDKFSVVIAETFQFTEK